jgi:hypothetical protein
MKFLAHPVVAKMLHRSVAELTRLACILALLGLGVIVYPLLSPGVLSIVLSMVLGHVLGIAAFGCYLLAVIVDIARRRGT